MRTGAIFARGSCRALKWMALVGMVFALLVASSGTTLAQQTLTDVTASISGPRTVNEGDEATFIVRVTGTLGGRDTDNDPPTRSSADRTVTVEVGVATDTQESDTTGEFGVSGQPNDGAIVTNTNVVLTFDPNTGSGERGRTATGEVTFRTNADDDAEDEVIFLRVNTVTAAGGATLDGDGGVGETARFTVLDAQEQAYTLTLSRSHTSTNPPKEFTDIMVDLKAVPAHHDDGATITLYVDGADGKAAQDYAALGDSSTAGSSTAAIGTVNPADASTPLTAAVNTRAITISQSHNETNGDGNRMTDTITLRAFTGAGRNSEQADTLDIEVRDEHGLPAADAITAMAKDEDGEEIMALVEGGDPVFLTVTVDRGRGTFITDEALEVEIRPADPMQVVDYDLTGGRFTLEERTSGKQTNDDDDEIELSARSDDDDIGPEDLMLSLVVSGSNSRRGSETSIGTFSIPITDMTMPLVSVKDDAYGAIMAQRGADDEPLNPGDSFSVMTDDLFAYDPMAVTVAFGISVEGPAVTATASGEAVMVSAVGAGESKVTVTANATPKSSSLIVTQTDSDMAQLTFPVNVVLADLSVMVVADPMEVMEGASTMLTATANRAVTEDTMIGLVVVGDEDAYMVGDAITIANGMMSGSVELMASEDDDYMDETLTVIASGPGIDGSMQIEVMVTDNDEAPVDEPTVTAKSQEQVDAVFAAAIVMAAGGPDWIEGTDAAMVDMSTLFNVDEDSSPSYSGMSSDEMVVSASSSGMMLTLMPMADGMATITVTATDAASGGIATAMSEVTVADLPLSVTVSAAADMVTEGASVMITATANKMVDVDTMVMLARDGTSSASEDDYSLDPMSITIAAGEMTGAAALMATDDHDVEGNESLTLNVTMGGTSLGAVMVTIEDNDAETTYTLSASAETVEEGGTVTITATASQMVRANTEVMVMRDGASAADGDDYSLEPPLITIMEGETEGSLTLTATDDHDVEGNENLTLNGMVGDMAAGSVMLAITDNDMDITYTLSGPEDMNLAEGMSAELTATASSAVHMDTEVMIMRDGSSTASDADYTAESIMIMAGETVGTTMVMAVEDNEPDSGSGSPEMLTLYGMVDGMQTNSVSFYLWDAAVPALPVIAQLLLAAFLAIGGYRRYQRR